MVKKLRMLFCSILLVVGASVSLITPNASAIVGGMTATQQYGTVSIWYPDRHRCTGTLIGARWVLTAAHCNVIVVPGQTEIRASSLTTTEGYESAKVAAAYTHPNFDSHLYTNDVMLLKLDRSINNTKFASLTNFVPTVGSTTKVAGWGWTCEEFDNPDCRRVVTTLQELNVKIAANMVCPALWDPANELCGVAAGDKLANACFGDSGAPMLSKGATADSWRIVGITLYDADDWGNPFRVNACATNPSGGPGAGAWVKVAPYINWINQTMSAN